MSMREAHPKSALRRAQAPLKELAAWLIDLIFPPACSGCGRVDFRFCAECQGQLAAAPITPRPIQPAPIAAGCATGRHAGILRQAILAFKYSRATELTAPLADRLLQVLAQQSWRFDRIVPVPLSPQRLRERGYNQASLLSRVLSEKLGIPCQPTDLRRIRNTSQQTQLSGRQRIENVKGAFAASTDFAGQALLLVDDVITTGSTLSACASALIAGGAGTVYALTISHS